MKKLIATSVLAALTSFSALAEEPSFNFVEGGYADNYDTDGFMVRSNLEMTQDVFFTGSYESVGENGVDVNTTALGIGYKLDIGTSSAVYGKVSWLDLEVDTPFGDGSEDGYQLGVGYRNQFTKESQFYTEVNHNDIDGAASTLLSVGLRQQISNNLGAFIEAKTDDFDNDGFALGMTYNF